MASQQRLPSCPSPDTTLRPTQRRTRQRPVQALTPGGGQSGHVIGLATSMGKRRPTLRPPRFTDQPECEEASQLSTWAAPSEDVVRYGVAQSVSGSWFVREDSDELFVAAAAFQPTGALKPRRPGGQHRTERNRLPGNDISGQPASA
jgi:hypothetical protein